MKLDIRPKVHGLAANPNSQVAVLCGIHHDHDAESFDTDGCVPDEDILLWRVYQDSEIEHHSPT